MKHCQTDYLVEFEHLILLVEVKLTQQLKIVKQVLNLYKPVVENAFGKPVVSVQVCRNLIDAGPSLVRNPRALPTFNPSNRVWTVHHLA